METTNKLKTFKAMRANYYFFTLLKINIVRRACVR